MSNFDMDTIRHSAAHLMAQAISRLFKEHNPQFGIGPVINNGFYYDIEMDYKLTDADLKNIEKEMKKIIKENLPIERKVLSRDEALTYFGESNQDLKIEIINDLPEDAEISCYAQGDFTDLCRGPHVESTKQIPMSFKLTNTAGAYWRGDSDRQMLQRVYAVAFENKEQLKEHLHFLEEAKKRDHRVLAKELDLVAFDKVATASPFFTPRGTIIYNELIEFLRRLYHRFDYKEVITPQIMDSELWHTSGHYQNYKENMFFSNIDNREFAVKPMNCPAHMVLYKHNKFSYRDLPLRYADFGRIHRYEKSGTLAGLTRVRTFVQDDGHIFLEMGQVQDEIKALMEMIFMIYDHFGFDKVKINLSTRPEKKVGDDATWDKAEAALEEALKVNGREYEIKEGDGAFYGPKIDVEVSDAIGRHHQLGTIQLDFQLPERFDLKYTAQDGELKRPVVIHRALLGSLERFFGILIEHTAGVFPFWIAPLQAVIVPINIEAHGDYCQNLYTELKRKGYRVEVDMRNESIGKKTRETQKSKVPFMLVIGDKEMEENSVSVRKYGERDSNTWSHQELLQNFKELAAENLPKDLRA